MLWSRPNFAWATGGRDNHILLAGAEGVASVLLTPDRIFCFADTIETPRFREEELAGLPIEFVHYPWHDRAAGQRVLKDLIDPATVAADADPLGVGHRPLDASFRRLRWQLEPAEIERYREGARRTRDALEDVALQIEPGMSELDCAARIHFECTRRGVKAIVNLVASDERVDQFRHPIPTDKPIDQKVMLVACGEFGGLISSLTRMVHFGPLDPELRRRHDAVMQVDAAINLATTEGRTMGELFETLQAAYAEVGFADEWQHHHQGGSTGYAGRDVFARPGDATPVLNHQAFAWNPSITGTKSEDTVIVTDGVLQWLTTPGDAWPSEQIDGVDRADILMR